MQKCRRYSSTSVLYAKSSYRGFLVAPYDSVRQYPTNPDASFIYTRSSLPLSHLRWFGGDGGWRVAARSDFRLHRLGRRHLTRFHSCHSPSDGAFVAVVKFLWARERCAMSALRFRLFITSKAKKQISRLKILGGKILSRASVLKKERKTDNPNEGCQCAVREAHLRILFVRRLLAAFVPCC